mmetsp:Transcript_150468/g.265569  ORF Transcript_150468/g.265569 Transcript_150468/m.265569 type:complete len:83 (-) Transcript_150468:85-333(-)
MTRRAHGSGKMEARPHISTGARLSPTQWQAKKIAWALATRAVQSGGTRHVFISFNSSASSEHREQKLPFDTLLAVPKLRRAS